MPLCLFSGFLENLPLLLKIFCGCHLSQGDSQLFETRSARSFLRCASLNAKKARRHPNIQPEPQHQENHGTYSGAESSPTASPPSSEGGERGSGVYHSQQFYFGKELFHHCPTYRPQRSYYFVDSSRRSLSIISHSNQYLVETCCRIRNNDIAASRRDLGVCRGVRRRSHPARMGGPGLGAHVAV